MALFSNCTGVYVQSVCAYKVFGRKNSSIYMNISESILTAIHDMRTIVSYFAVSLTS